MSYDETITQDELKKAYLIKLINMIDTIGWLLAENHQTDAMKLLASLMARIQIPKESKDLRQLQQNLVYNYESYLPQIKTEDTRKLYYLVSQYMNETYFKELNWARPRFKEEGHLE